jgi:cell pole-organizing protein PopZ
MSYTNHDIHNAAGPGSSAEPSMEEILASIRRILKEDEPGKPAEPATAPVEMDDDILLLDESMIAKPADLSTATTLPTEPMPEGEHPTTPLAPASEPLHFSSEPVPFARDYVPTARAMPEPVLELPAEDDEPEADPHPGPQMFGDPTISLHDDTELTPDEAPAAEAHEPDPEPEAPYAPPEPAWANSHTQDEPAYAEPPQPEPEPQYQPAYEAAPQYARAQDDEPATETYHAAYHEPETTTSEPIMNENAPDSFQPPESLISDQATSAAASSIGALVRSMTTEKSVAISKGSSITIEDIVRDEIRPLLKSWLDSHLPSLVERIVRIEIERVISRSVV